MKTLVTLPIAVVIAAAAAFFPSSPGAPNNAGSNDAVASTTSAPEPAKLYWYRIDQQDGMDLAGASNLSPDELVDSLAAGRYLCLLSYRDDIGYGNWDSGQNKVQTGRIYIRPDLVRTVRELTDDPMKFNPPPTVSATTTVVPPPAKPEPPEAPVGDAVATPEAIPPVEGRTEKSGH